MILHALHALYDRLQADPDYKVFSPGFSLQKVSFKVVLEPDGSLLELQDHRRTKEGKQRTRQLRVLGDSKPSGSGLNPCFLWDNSSYLLGFKAEDPKPERTHKAFEAFREKHLELEAAIDSPVFSAVCRFLKTWDPADAERYPEFQEAATTGFGVFQLQGREAYVHNDPAILEWWQGQLLQEESATLGQCLITGDNAPLARLHPKIRGVRGAQGAGATIAGFNEDAYESYGKKQSYNAPVSQEAAFRYTTALNALLDGPMRAKHSFPLGDATVVFWTDQPTVTEDLFAQWISSADGSLPAVEQPAQREDLRLKLEIFLQALRQGRAAYGALESELEQPLEEARFFLLGLSPNAARLSVRFFHRGHLGELLDNLRLHLRHIGTSPQPAVGKRKADPEMPPAWLLLRQTAREPKDIPPTLAGPLLSAIVTGCNYPESLAAAVLRRIRADREVTYPRVCAIKGYLVRNLKTEVSMSLDTERPDPAYRIGRLFAALEKTQRDAHDGKLNKTIRDNFYSSASATPRSVFPRLLRTYQHHLNKLETKYKTGREKLVQEIIAPLTDWPAHFGLADQGLFAIGYYHQTRDFYTKKTASETTSAN